jgi:fructose-specific phosphotransferase system component IIB
MSKSIINNQLYLVNIQKIMQESYDITLSDYEYETSSKIALEKAKQLAKKRSKELYIENGGNIVKINNDYIKQAKFHLEEAKKALKNERYDIPRDTYMPEYESAINRAITNIENAIEDIDEELDTNKDLDDLKKFKLIMNIIANDYYKKDDFKEFNLTLLEVYLNSFTDLSTLIESMDSLLNSNYDTEEYIDNSNWEALVKYVEKNLEELRFLYRTNDNIEEFEQFLEDNNEFSTNIYINFMLDSILYVLFKKYFHYDYDSTYYEFKDFIKDITKTTFVNTENKIYTLLEKDVQSYNDKNDKYVFISDIFTKKYYFLKREEFEKEFR